MNFCHKWNMYCYDVFKEIDTDSEESWLDGEYCDMNCEQCKHMEEM